MVHPEGGSDEGVHHPPGDVIGYTPGHTLQRGSVEGWRRHAWNGRMWWQRQCHTNGARPAERIQRPVLQLLGVGAPRCGLPQWSSLPARVGGAWAGDEVEEEGQEGQLVPE